MLSHNSSNVMRNRYFPRDPKSGLVTKCFSGLLRWVVIRPIKSLMMVRRRKRVRTPILEGNDEHGNIQRSKETNKYFVIVRKTVFLLELLKTQKTLI